MRIVIGGASGMIGSALTRRLHERGDEVVHLVRRPVGSAAEISWDPAAGKLDAAQLSGAHAVVNLSGATLSRLPWTRRHKDAIVLSRLTATRTIVTALRELAAAGETPALLSGSAVGAYGSQPGARLDETAPRGSGFLADVVAAWEAEARHAPDGVRVVLLRTGLVLGHGGAGAVLSRITRLGAAGPIGGGRQYWPWVSLDDQVGGILHALDHDLEGPVNLVGPEAATAGAVMRAIARAAHRPYLLPLPTFAVSFVLGEGGRELLLSDQQVVPARLTDLGYDFAHAHIDDAADALFARPRAGAPTLDDQINGTGSPR
jgi:uncharacterized protein (TIGR01777 family)